MQSTTMAESTNRELQLASHIVNDTAANLFLTGRAGTGKTTFLRQLRQTSDKRIVVVAPTGVAAINADGVTIHSFFQLSFSPFIPGKGYASDNDKPYSFSKQKRRLIATIDLLVIDEISMVRPDTLDAVDATLRRLRNSSAPFGGVQLLLIGDLRQLPPIVKEQEWQMLSPYYSSPYFFESHALKHAGFLTVELQSVYRQSDARFIDILNAIRDGNASADTLTTLNSRYLPEFLATKHEGYIHLTTHNNFANAHNNARLSALKTPAVTFEADVKGEFPESSFPAERELTLKEGAQVMFIKNDRGSNRRYYNGLIGHITSISEKKVVVVPDDGGDLIVVEADEWDNTRYTLNEASGEIESQTIGTFIQIPLRLAWAITIHKSQGLTFDKAIVDIANSFAPGQTYVALSRCRSLEGLVLGSPIAPHAVIVDATVNSFMAQCADSQPDTTMVDSLRDDYFRASIADLFDFTPQCRTFDRFVDAMRQLVIPVDESQAPALDEHYMRMVGRINSVASKFCQLYASSPIDPNNVSDTLAEKIRGGCKYFAEELTQLIDYIVNLDIRLDNKAYISRLATIVEELLYRLTIKRDTLIKICDIDFTTSAYNKAKTEATLHYNPAAKPKPGKRKPRQPKQVAEKKPKGYSAYESLRLAKQGLTISQIAAERSLTPATIAGHLMPHVASGEIPLKDLIPDSSIRAMAAAMATSPDSISELRALVPGLPSHEVTLFYRTVSSPGQ